MNLIEALRPWSEVVLEQVPGIELFDAHTHLGQNDPDGMKQTGAELTAALEVAGARGAFVFPFHEPDGYRAANDVVLAAAARVRRPARPVLPRQPARRSPSPRPSVPWTPAPGGSSSIPAPRSSRSTTRA